VHIITVNDYLAKRDMVWMGQIFDALGLSTGCIVNESGYVYDKEYKNSEEDQQRDIVGGFKVLENYLKPVSRRMLI
jgi:preprotein translocase subunit SecA